MCLFCEMYINDLQILEESSELFHDDCNKYKNHGRYTYLKNRKELKLHDALSLVRTDIYQILVLNNLKKLVLDKCTFNEQILINFPNLVHLEITGRIEVLPVIPKLEILKLHGNYIKELPKMTTLKLLVCCDCGYLSKIDFPNLVELFCFNCPRLENIQSMNFLERLSVIDCKNITKIRYYPELYYLSCNKTNVKTIEYSSKLRYLFCSETKLSIIPNIASLEHISCEMCKFLLRIEVHHLEFLNCYMCPYLAHIPKDIEKPWNVNSCPFINDKETSMKNLVNAQKYARKFCKYICFRKWIHSKQFAEWFYDPEQLGGRLAKKSIQKFLTV